MAINSILGRLPVVLAGDTGTPFRYRNGCRNGAHRYDHTLAKAECWCLGLLPHVLCEFLGVGLVPRPVKLNEAECVNCIIYYYHLLMNQ